MENLWKTALKINLPATLAIFIVLKLLNPVFSNIEFIERNPIIYLLLVVFLLNFAIIFLVINRKNKRSIIKNSVIDNNEVDGSVEVNGDEIVKNRISGNTIKNDLKIGEGQ